MVAGLVQVPPGPDQRFCRGRNAARQLRKASQAPVSTPKPVLC